MRSLSLTGLLFLFLFCIYQNSLGNESGADKLLSKEQKQKFDELSKKSFEFPDSAISEAEPLLQQYKGSDQKQIRARLLKILGSSHMNLSNNRQALEYYEQALFIYRELDMKGEAGAVLNNIGIIREEQGDFSGALKRYMESEAISIEVSNDALLSLSYTNIGNIYYTMGRFDKALHFLTLSLRLNEKLTDSVGISKAYNNIGNVYLSLKDYDQALIYYNNALRINKSLNRLGGLSISYSNLGLVYEWKGDYGKALEFNRLSNELSRKNNDKEGIIHSLMNTGNIHLLRKEFNQATIALMEAERVSNNHTNGFLKASVAARLGQLKHEQGEFDESISYFKEALTFANRINSFSMLIDIYKGMAEAWQGKGDYKRAYEMLILHIAASDSIYNQENNERLNMLRVSFESENSERDNQLLKQQYIYSQLALSRHQTIRNFLIIISAIVIVFSLFLYNLYQSKNKKNRLLAERNMQINRQKDELNQLYKEQFKLNETKNKFFSIVAHDLKSPFQTILGFSELLSFEYEDLTDQQRKDSAINIMKVSRETFRLIENLLEWGRAQTGSTRATFKLFNVKDLVLKTVPVFTPQLEKKHLKIAYNLPDSLQGWADPDMIMAVLRNIISNAIKFSPVQSEIRISAEFIDDMVHISIADSGAGIPDEIKEKLFTLDPIVQRAGTMGERGTGLGLTLCMEFMELNQGNIEVKNAPGSGSVFTVVLQSDKSRPGK
ncbi:MAG: tetratricopeptide repeat-containing sensor histidine kinase [Lentimicrobium sp.]|nr:tetratricopeptide repeat-containing sensor histidine kinase [Lentimicrobium sp.]